MLIINKIRFIFRVLFSKNVIGAAGVNGNSSGMAIGDTEDVIAIAYGLMVQMLCGVATSPEVVISVADTFCDELKAQVRNEIGAE